MTRNPLPINLLNVTALSASLILTSACTTLWSKEKPGASAKERKALHGQPVVAQRDRSVMAKLDRRQWVDLRKTTNSGYLKMYAALGAREWNAASKDARHYLLRHPGDATATRVLAISLAMSGKYQLANWYAKRLQKKRPDSGTARNIRALAILNRSNPRGKDFRLAIRLLGEAFDSSSREVAAGLNLGYLLLETGNASRAGRIFATVRDRCDDCLESLLGLGAASVRTKNYKTAKSAYETILDDNPEQSLALYRLALVEKNGFNNRAGAKEHLKKILSDTSSGNMRIKRRANTLLRQLQARDEAPEPDEDTGEYNTRQVREDD